MLISSLVVDCLAATPRSSATMPTRPPPPQQQQHAELVASFVANYARSVEKARRAYMASRDDAIHVQDHVVSHPCLSNMENMLSMQRMLYIAYMYSWYM